MNKKIFNYKRHFFTFSLLLAYVFAHLYLTGFYIDATLEDLMQGSARLPFAQRILVPSLAFQLGKIWPSEVFELFFVLELGFISLFYLALKKLLTTAFDPPKAQALSWLFILVLPLITVVNYRFSIHGEATLFYPYDTASLFFLATGFLFCLQQRWILFYVLLFLAILNRESSILLVFLIPTLYWQNKSSIIKPFVLSLALYTVTRYAILWLLNGHNGPWIEWYSTMVDLSYFSINLYWLLDYHYLAVFLLCMAGVPYLWFTFYDFIPLRFRPLRYLTLVYFCGLAVFGLFVEARILTEIVVLLYLPVCIAVQNWFDKAEPLVCENKNIVYYIDRYFVLGTLLLIAVFRTPINHLILRLGFGVSS